MVLVPAANVKTVNDVKVEAMTAIAVKAKLRWHYNQQQEKEKAARKRAKTAMAAESQQRKAMFEEDRIMAGGTMLYRMSTGWTMPQT